MAETTGYRIERGHTITKRVARATGAAALAVVTGAAAAGCSSLAATHHESNTLPGFISNGVPRTGDVTQIRVDGSIVIDSCGPKNPVILAHGDEGVDTFQKYSVAAVETSSGRANCTFTEPYSSNEKGALSGRWVLNQVNSDLSKVVGAIVEAPADSRSNPNAWTYAGQAPELGYDPVTQPFSQQSAVPGKEYGIITSDHARGYYTVATCAGSPAYPLSSETMAEDTTVAQAQAAIPTISGPIVYSDTSCSQTYDTDTSSGDSGIPDGLPAGDIVEFTFNVNADPSSSSYGTPTSWSLIPGALAKQ